MSVGFTSGEGHVYKLTVVVRYMEEIRSSERFFTLISNCGHTVKQMATALGNYLEDLGIYIKNCRDQSYDNISNMSGKYQGMQSMILKLNTYVVFVPCCAHSLIMVGKTAFISSLYNNFSFSLLELPDTKF